MSDELSERRSFGPSTRDLPRSALHLPVGAVLGIDVGYSAKRATTGLCLVRWDTSTVSCDVDCTHSDEARRTTAIRKLAGNVPLPTVAIDGPLTHDLGCVHRYRAAESLLTHGKLQRRGKPGATNSPSGQKLHQHATALARSVLAHAEVSRAAHRSPIHERAIVEAFPNLFLGVLHPDEGYPQRPLTRRNWTDTLFPRVKDRLKAIVTDLLPGRSGPDALFRLSNHEHVAAFVCALTALCVARGHYVAVGADGDGYIVLPPSDYWGRDGNGDAWAEVVLRENIQTVRSRFPNARLVCDCGEWMPLMPIVG